MIVMVLIHDSSTISYLLCKTQEHQLGQDRHSQLGMLCSFQIFLLKSTFQQDKELVGY